MLWTSVPREGVHMQQVSPADAERILAAALDRPAGIELVFGALAEVPGVDYDPGRPRGFMRAATPATLRAAEWSFSPSKAGNTLEAGHTVRGVVLSRATLPPADAAVRLAPAVLEAARQQGSEALEQAESIIGALGEVLGL